MCLICERIEMIKEQKNPYFVKELDTGYVVIGDHQFFHGYTLFLYKEHQTELHHLDRDTKLRFLEEMSLVQEAVAMAFGAEKMNCELLGNGDAHLHWHLFPRKAGDLGVFGHSGRGPVWWYPWEKMIDDSNRPSVAEIKRMKERLLTELVTLGIE